MDITRGAAIALILVSSCEAGLKVPCKNKPKCPNSAEITDKYNDMNMREDGWTFSEGWVCPKCNKKPVQPTPANPPAKKKAAPKNGFTNPLNPAPKPKPKKVNAAPVGADLLNHYGSWSLSERGVFTCNDNIHVPKIKCYGKTQYEKQYNGRTPPGCARVAEETT